MQSIAPRVPQKRPRFAPRPSLKPNRGAKVPRPVRPPASVDSEEESEHVWHELFVRVPSLSDGNCFFDSVRIILSRIPKEHIAIINNTLSGKGITAHKEEGKFLSCKEYTNDYLRVLVAASIYRPECYETIKMWRLMFANACREEDGEVQMRLSHVSCLKDQMSEDLDDTDLDKLYRQMRQNSYWADEFAVGMIEEYFGVRFILINEEGKVEGWINNNPGFDPKLFILMFYNNEARHYEPLKYVGPDGDDNRFSFTFDEIPKTIVEMAQRDIVGEDVPWYVNLSEKD